MSIFQAVQTPALVALGTWRVQPGQALSFCSKKAAVLRLDRGRLWVTIGGSDGGTPGDSGDLWLAAGDALAVPAGAWVVAEAVSAADGWAVAHFERSDRAVRTSRFASEVALPTRELVAALALAGVSLAKVGRGLLRWAGRAPMTCREQALRLDACRL